MAARCEICGKGPEVGNKVSHSHHKTKRRFLPNLQTVRMDDGFDGTIRVRVCTSCIKAGKVQRTY